jgi:pyridoxine 5'-phosphate synthase PdxJ
MCNINQAEITSDDGLVVVARRTIVAKGVKINAKGNAVVASFSELVDKVHRLEKYVQATAAELYDNFGTKYAFEELVEEKNKQT